MLELPRRLIFSTEEQQVIDAVKSDLLIRGNSGDDGEVLIDISDNLCECLEQIAFAKYFSETFRLKPTVYYPGFSNARVLLSRLIAPQIYRALSRGYRLAGALGMKPGLDVGRITAGIETGARADLNAFNQKAVTKDEVLQYKHDRVNIGIAIYDTYLRLTKKPTIDKLDPVFTHVAYEAFLLLRTIADYFDKHDVKVVVLGHCVYNSWKILSDFAVAQGCGVYVSYNSRSIPLHDVSRNRGLQTLDHSKYKEQFARMSAHQQANSRAQGLELLKSRLAGKLDAGISYMAMSAYSNRSESPDFVLDGHKRVIVVMLHSFFDSPHIYEGMVFPDFAEWLDQTLLFLSEDRYRKAYEVLIKPHPNRFLEEDAIIDQFIRKYPWVHLLPGEFSNARLVNLNLACIVTVHGTVAPEFAFLRIPVITCGDNPAVSFDFCFHAKDREQYFALLADADKLVVAAEKAEEVGDFMFMNYIQHRSPIGSAYPFERYRRHISNNNHERVRNFRYPEFKSQVDESMLMMSRRMDSEPSCAWKV